MSDGQLEALEHRAPYLRRHQGRAGLGLGLSIVRRLLELWAFSRLKRPREKVRPPACGSFSGLRPPSPSGTIGSSSQAPRLSTRACVVDQIWEAATWRGRIASAGHSYVRPWPGVSQSAGTARISIALATVLLAGAGDGSVGGPPPEVHLPPLNFSGRVVGIADGQTIDVMWKDRLLRVRLAGVACPRTGHVFSGRARAFTSELVLGREVTVVGEIWDRTGQLVARVVAGGRDASLELLRVGFARRVRYAADPELAAAEEDARARQAGLWTRAP